MRSKEYPFGIKTIAVLCKEEISIQEKQVDFKNSINGNSKSMLKKVG